MPKQLTPLAFLLSILLVLFLAEATAYTITTPRPKDTTWVRLGVADDSHPVTFTMTLRSEHTDELHDKMQDIALQRGAWLTSEQLSYYVKPSSEALSAVQAFLDGKGLIKDAGDIGRHQNTLTVKTVAKTAAEIFATDLHLWQDGQTSTVHAKATKIIIPDAIAPYVIDVRGFNTFLHRPVPVKVSTGDPRAEFASRDGQPPNTPSFPTGPSGVHEPPPGCSDLNVSWPCLARFYGYEGYTPLPKSESLAVVVWDPFHDEGIHTFEDNFRRDALGYLPNKRYLAVNDSSWDNPPSPEDGETTMDTETIIAIGYPLDLTVYVSKTNFIDSFRALIELPDEERPGIVSLSFAGEEQLYNFEESRATCQAIQQLAALGTTLAVACGDYGVTTFAVEQCPPFTGSVLCACPYALSVGATMNLHDEKAAYNVHHPDNLYKSWSTGGFSNYFAPLEYQQEAVQNYLSRLDPTVFAYFNASGRGFVDISSQGWYINCWTNGKPDVGRGQSASTPQVASMLALINSKCKEKGKPRVGWVHPVLYAHPEATNDITIGGSYVCDNTTLGFPSGPGWDPATGLGSPHFPNLVKVFGCE